MAKVSGDEESDIRRSMRAEKLILGCLRFHSGEKHPSVARFAFPFGGKLIVLLVLCFPQGGKLKLLPVLHFPPGGSSFFCPFCVSPQGEAHLPFTTSLFLDDE